MNELLEDSEAGKIQLKSTHLALISFCPQLTEERQRSAGSYPIINCVIRGKDSNAYFR